MTILVTGATGFLGGHCVRAIANSGPVIATGRKQSTLAELQVLSNVTTIACDLSDPGCIEQLAELQPTAIVHSAAFSSLWGPLEQFHRANVVGTQHVLNVAERCDAQLVHISTPTLYMDGTNRLDLDESSPRSNRGVNAYAETKRLAEIEIRDRTGVRSIILRPQGIVGAGDTAVAPRFLHAMRRGVFPLINQGRAMSELTHVSNVVQAIELALRLDIGETGTLEFNITNGEPMSTRELLDIFLQVRAEADPDMRPVRYVGVPERLLQLAATVLERASLLTGAWEPTITCYSVQVLSRDRTFNIDAARDVLGYDPSRHSTRDAFVDFFAHCDGSATGARTAT